MDTFPRISRDALTRHHGVAAFVDVETTGLDPGHHEVLELAIVLFAFDRETGTIVGILDEYVGLREPSRPIPREATAVHGITRRMVKGRRLDDDRVRTLLNQAEVIIAHNARFDRAFISRLYPEAARKVWLCSMRGVDWARHGYRSRGLQHLLAAHGIKVDTAHRAGADCRAALALLNCRGREGDTYLRELLGSQMPLTHQMTGPVSTRSGAAQRVEGGAGHRGPSRGGRVSLPWVILAGLAFLAYLLSR
nr:MAG: DNA polymerase III subunit epsilon [Bacillota bacterium]